MLLKIDNILGYFLYKNNFEKNKKSIDNLSVLVYNKSCRKENDIK